MDDTATWSTLLTATHGLSTLVALACSVVLVVVAATVVRRHRPDAAGALLAWAITSLVLALVLPLLSTFANLFAGRLGIGAILRVQIGLTLLGVPIHVGTVALLVRALVKLAQPPKVVTPDGVGPYR